MRLFFCKIEILDRIVHQFDRGPLEERQRKRLKMVDSKQQKEKKNLTGDFEGKEICLSFDWVENADFLKWRSPQERRQRGSQC